MVRFTTSVIEGMRVGASGKEAKGDGDRIFVRCVPLAGSEWLLGYVTASATAFPSVFDISDLYTIRYHFFHQGIDSGPDL